MAIFLEFWKVKVVCRQLLPFCLPGEFYRDCDGWTMDLMDSHSPTECKADVCPGVFYKVRQ